MKLLPEEKQHLLNYRKWKKWLAGSMPPYFYKVTSEDEQAVLAYYLQNIESSGNMNFSYSGSLFSVRFRTPDSVIEDLEQLSGKNIRSSEIHVSSRPVKTGKKSRYIQIHKITLHGGAAGKSREPDRKRKEAVRKHVAGAYANFPLDKFDMIYGKIDHDYLKLSPVERIGRYMNLFSKAIGKDNVFAEIEQVRRDKDHDAPSSRLMIACRNIPRSGFFLSLARIFRRFDYNLERAYVSTLEQETADQVSISTFYLTDNKGRSLSRGPGLDNFLEELSLVKWVSLNDDMDRILVRAGVFSMNQANLIRTAADFVHLIFAEVDIDKYNRKDVYEAFIRHSDISLDLFNYFGLLHDPARHDDAGAKTLGDSIAGKIGLIDTGIPVYDDRRKNILRGGLAFIGAILRTNYYIKRKSALSFRLDPAFMEKMIPDCKKKYPQLPFGVFYVSNRDFKGFHVRFDNFARGGLRTIILDDEEKVAVTSDQLFKECYNLAYTQQLKNKDIPEGGAKGIILLDTGGKIAENISLLGAEPGAVAKYKAELRKSCLFEAQRVFVNEMFDVLIPEKGLLDRYGRQELVFFGPDENMTDEMIEWISAASLRRGYFAGTAFMSGKPDAGINHKEYGVTSLGVNTYLEEALRHAGIDPARDIFSVKFSGGPDGDVAGNEMKILLGSYPGKARITTITDGGGAAHDPAGLDDNTLMKLVAAGRAVDDYPPEKLGKGGYLLNIKERKETGTTAVLTAFYRNEGRGAVKTWLSGNEANRIYANHLNEVYADAFIPAGGRPRAINTGNAANFIMPDGKPSAKVIIEGANLYIEQEARRELEKKGVILVKDSSANKCGVICSSFEVLAGLLLSENEFKALKPLYVGQVLEALRDYARKEALLLFKTRAETGEFLCDISDKISIAIQELNSRISGALSSDSDTNLLLKRFHGLFKDYLPAVIYEKYYGRIPEKLALTHLKAIISAKLASDIVYKFGLTRKPSGEAFPDDMARSLYQE